MQDLPEELWHPSFRFYVKEDPNRRGGPNLRLLRLDPQKPALTVTGFIFNKFVHPKENRFITPREAARLQGFPDDWVFEGTLTSAQRQVGNAVPVPLATAVAKAMLEFGIAQGVFATTRPKVLSLFSGAGGLDLGFSNAKSGRYRWNITDAVEFDPDSCKTLRTNSQGHTQVHEQDIRSFDVARQAEAPDAIIGGPPCQAFSQAGLQKGAADQRGQMVHEFIRCVSEAMPKCFLMENVSNLKSIDGGKLLAGIISDLEKIGYKVSLSVLNAADFGAAQFRKRLIVVGFRKDLVSKRFSMPLPTHSAAPGFGLQPQMTVGEAFKGLPETNLPDHAAA
jgi:DNA (cytosine-5)-methyltransferase 1